MSIYSKANAWVCHHIDLSYIKDIHQVTLRPLWRLLFSLLLVSYCQSLMATETKHNEPKHNEAKHNEPRLVIPKDGARDSNGKPLPIPETPSSALHYSSSETREPKEQKRKKSQKQRTSKSSNQHNNQLARSQVADDPSCRWLDNRIRQLEKQLRHTSASRYGFHRDELNIRETEWQCLKCGGEGPKVADHARCQHRR
ncbi:hypothetical protein LZP69_14655 [Shewanella sp. AS1]|uniref:hypothetical protein n=1 Tax=Shewanella sp. AS1 TaxID=2907626 RepID=UPI001F468CF5|nr:hypothetical protein [Shewanella sp. AS1]MCE9680396.1 hypothetical protein [Shewanella sp. AS1]